MPFWRFSGTTTTPRPTTIPEGRGATDDTGQADAVPADLGVRTFLVTGASSGIGRALVEALAARNARLVLAGRSEARTMPVLERLRSVHQGLDATFLRVDVSSFGSIRDAAGSFLRSGHPLDVLVNNAGVAGTRGLSADGIDVTYATNHLGPFLLTSLLAPRLQESEQGRVVNVASAAHLGVKAIDWSVFERRTTPRRRGFRDYAVTKLMNVLHARELARRLGGSRVTTSALHPGAVASDIWRSLPSPVQWLLKQFLLTNAEGARTPLYCAASPALRDVSGRYYDRCREARPNPLAESEALARELWERSAAVVGA